MEKGIIVLAVGGKAISSRTRTFDAQYKTISKTTKQLSKLVTEGHRLVITHGNGPQVGDALLRNEYSKDFVPSLPLFACVAETQGMLGSMIQTAMVDVLGTKFKIANLVTHVIVSRKDPAFKNPTKTIGPFMTKDEVARIKQKISQVYFKYHSGKYIRVVPSPEPISILEIDAIKRLIRDNYVIIAGGGGGIPIMSDRKINFTEAVVDKDLTGQLLATRLNASMFVSLTDVKGAYVNFKNKDQRLLQKTSVSQMKNLLEKGCFEKGSMEPKVRAAIRFVQNTGRIAVIASFKDAIKAINLKSGTIVNN